MSTTRTQQYTNTLASLGAPRVGVACTLTLFTPNNLPVSNLDGQTIQPGQVTQDQESTNSLGVYLVSGWALADLPLGCYYQVSEGGYLVTITSLTYSATPLAVSTFYPTPASLANTLLMKATLATIDGTGMNGETVLISLSDKAVNLASVSIPGGVQQAYQTDINGRVQLAQDITTTLTPSNTVYQIQWPGNGYIDSYVVPATPHGYQGAYAAGTTYQAHAGTQVSPADVVTSGGLLYRYINAAPAAGQTPATSPTYWAVFDGEPIEWNIVAAGASGTRNIAPSQLSADSAVATGTYPVPPLTLQDQLRQLTQYPVTHVTAATYAVLATDKIVDADGTTNAVAVTLPASSTGLIAVKAINVAHAVTITNTIDGVTGPFTLSLNECLVLYWDGTTWRIHAAFITDTDLSGTVTSVGLTVPAWLAVAGSPITAAGTLAVTTANQTANTALLGPASGAAAAPGFRALVAADLPIVLATYAPALQGATDNPVATYTTQIGRYYVIGKLCFLSLTIVTSTMTKTTLTDSLRIALPVAAANIANAISQLAARVENSTAVKVALRAETTPNTTFLQLREVSSSAASAMMTYGVGDLGVLTNVITYVVTGCYETV